eukprot:GSChrysophyteH1.ASY1.ANO1.1523.1 assembled CDS
MGEEFNSYTKAAIFEKLNSLNLEIEDSIRFESSFSDAQVSQQLEDIKDKAYLERAPEAHHATLLFRAYRGLVNGKGSSSRVDNSNRASLDTWWESSTEIPGKLAPHLFPNGLEGTGEVLVGMEATKTNAFMMRSLIGLLSLVSFIVLCSSSAIHADLLPIDLFHDDCPLMKNSDSFTGEFNMTPYQWLIAIAWFVFMQSACFAGYYLLPVDDAQRKYIPGFGDWMENCLNRMQHEPTSAFSRNASGRISDFFHEHSKILEWYADFTLLVLTLMICIICSIDIERGALFTLGEGQPYENGQWFTLATFHLTFAATSPPCVGESDPSSFIRASLGMLYISAFFQTLSMKISRDSYYKYEAKKAGDLGREGGLPTGGYADAQQRRGLMNSVDDEDTVEVTL